MKTYAIDNPPPAPKSPRFRLFWHDQHGYWYVQMQEEAHFLWFWGRWYYVLASPEEKRRPEALTTVSPTQDWSVALRAREFGQARVMGLRCQLLTTHRHLQKLSRWSRIQQDPYAP